MQNPGYFIEKNIFSASECDDLTNILSQANRTKLQTSKRKQAGARHLMSNTQIAKVAKDKRLINFAEKLLGNKANPFRATLFDKSLLNNWLVTWHQDRALPLKSYFDDKAWGPWSKKEGVLYAHAPTWALSQIVALRIHLDAATSENGPLKIIPCSHLLGILSDKEVLSYSKSNSSIECLVDKGGVLAMSPLLIHCSSKAKSDKPRRVLHIEYAINLELATNISLALA
ncbi:MAG: phytanoyl-CoA dioxygenase family protein [Blastocatellia bacterium]|nr:phytanoyl-CoA dioxygenase family protein [Blastocatellia bacterium]MBN8723333.1 phytanoyl-CoA dioxygenase family protein [Acidobacteriota bacterium]